MKPMTPPETIIETLSILSILITRFPAQLSSPDLDPQPVTALTPLLSHPRPAVRKRAILTLAQFLPSAPQALFDELVKSTALPGLRLESGGLEAQRTAVQLVGAIARQSSGRIAPVLDEIIPGVLKAASQEDDESREYALQTLEVFVLKCPTEIAPFLGQIVQTGIKLIRYDPNYAGDDEDEEMGEADAEEEDDDDDDGDMDYSDDEDTSYKIRRAATKLLTALIETRPEMLSSLYQDVSPVLILRFGDREETVRLEIWAAYGALLGQTRLYGGIPQAHDVVESPGVGGKRKRAVSTTDGMDVELLPESPGVLLRTQVPSLAKALLAQLRGKKTPPQVLQAGFGLLNQLIAVLPGCLSSHVGPIIATSKVVLSSSPNTSSIQLHTTVLAFLTSFFSTHSPSTFSNFIPDLTPVLLKSLGERHPRVAAETFRAFSALLNALRPVRDGEWVDSVYDQAVTRLRSADTDAEVRGCAEGCIGDLWVCATGVVRVKGGAEWEVVCRTTGRMEGAVAVVSRVAREVDVEPTWLDASVQWVLGVIRRSGKAGKGEAFTCLDTLLRR